MITVTHDGVEYTKASEVAKKFGYTSDYIGQLCRAKKINARLVGRSWFVSIASLEEHREKKYAKKPTAKESTDSQKSDFEKKVTIEKSDDIPSKKYLRRVGAPKARVKQILNASEQSGELHVPIHYEEDDNSLIPKIDEHPQITLLKVVPAGASSLKVTSSAKKPQKFAPEPIPEVSLSGKLSVQSVPDEDQVENEEDDKVEADDVENEVTTIKRDKPINKAESKIEVIDKEKKGVYKVKLNTAADSFRQKIEDAQEEKKTVKVAQVAPNVPMKAQKMPPSALETHAVPVSTHEILVDDPDFEAPPQSIRIEIPALAVVTAVVFALVILSLEQVTVVTAESASNSLEFVWRNVLQMASVLFTYQ